ncbi:hypothetical protein BU24DRAFT_496894 [Aaosphaeria arxii CBS 175.79]|uniref:Fungal N-terminal domain-containing protein n=1 Tax=Aaosphaeria arxii CBS 175.79 TaxID=1450172 RepID=A0A6A5XAX9_9PLEO|nr:uncharacterized protein BU24DRAFT_496894 [Aaosphaeria arxii CBS 175.79]KAF2010112.1 hypothetical protein BU24DRAFT_496894 [Aaosphaeria arxii CBS 175.79]
MDPFSVAGSAVGVTSLGLQICQALIVYYGKFRSFHDDVDAVVRRSESLGRNLKALESLKIRLGDGEVSSDLQKSMDTVALALRKLNEYAKRCGEIKVPVSQRDQARLVTKRLLWPFRHDTLLYLQDTLDRTQADLELALQIIDFGVAHNHTEALEEVRETLKSQNDIIEIERGNRTIEMTSIQNQTSLISSQLSAIKRRLDIIVLPNARTMNLTSFPSSSSNEKGHDETLLCSQNQTAENRREPLQEIANWKGSRSARCHCRYFARNQIQIKFSISHWLWFPIRIEEVSDHMPGCQYYASGDRVQTIKTHFNVRIAGSWNYHVKASWTHAQTSIWSTISPVLRFHPVVPTDSPGFEPFNRLLQESLKEFRSLPRIHHLSDKGRKRNWKLRLYQTLNTVRDNFKHQRASPLDINTNGMSIVKLILKHVMFYLEQGLLDIDEFNILLNDLELMGLRLNQEVSYAMLLLHMKYGSQVGSLCLKYDEDDVALIYSHVIRTTGSWSLPNTTLLLMAPQGFFDFIYELLLLEKYDRDFEEESPLTSAIVHRSQQELLLILQSKPPSSFYTSIEFNEALSIALSWPSGLKSLLSNIPGGLSILGADQSLLMNHALNLNNRASIRILLHNNISVTPDLWRCACYLQDGFEAETRNEIFTYMATYLARAGCTSRLYHEYKLTPIAAQCLWDAGFPLDQDTGCPGRSSPLWSHARLADPKESSWAATESLLEWLVSKGCSLDWVHPQHRTTSAHFIARQFACSGVFTSINLDDSLPPCSEFMMDVLLRGNRDVCCCHCSEDGCTVIGSAIKLSSGLVDTIEERRTGMLHFVYEIVDLHDDRRWMAPAIIRILTFDKLNLTHTCCHESLKRWWLSDPPDCSEIDEIHVIEKKDIELLERLMEEFTAAWETHTGKFQEFIDNVWEPKMEEECGELSDIDESQIQRIMDIGVVLDKVETQTVSTEEG